ncbi:MAG: enolase C-terminal domain-like protein [Acidobacteriota bacterium]
MRLQFASITAHRGALKKKGAASNARRAWGHREAWLLEVRDEAGRLGVGEASPLPGYSPDSLEANGRALKRWCQSARGRAFEPATAAEPGRSGLGAVRRAVSELPADCPAARFAVETALLDLLGQRQERPLHRLLGAGDHPRSLAALLDLGAAQGEAPLAGRIAGLRRLGIRHFKVKIGRPGAWESELRGLEEASAGLGPGERLRLDANGSLPARGLEERLGQLAAFDPEFLEEPVSWPRLGELGDSPVPLALDEGLRHGWDAVAGWAASGPASVVVLKPMVLGGALACLELAARAAERGLSAVASHLFDGPIALQATAALALALPGEPRAHGLARHAGLHAWEWSGEEGWLVGRGALDPADARPGLGLAR